MPPQRRRALRPGFPPPNLQPRRTRQGPLQNIPLQNPRAAQVQRAQSAQGQPQRRFAQRNSSFRQSPQIQAPQRNQRPNFFEGIMNLAGLGPRQQTRRGLRLGQNRIASENATKLVEENAKSRVRNILLPQPEGKGTARLAALRAQAAGMGKDYLALKQFLELVQKDEKLWKKLSNRQYFLQRTGQPTTLSEIKMKVLESIADGSIGSFDELQVSLTAVNAGLFNKKQYAKFVKELFSEKEIKDLHFVFGTINKTQISIPPQLTNQPFDTDQEKKARKKAKKREKMRNRLTPNLARVNQRATQQVEKRQRKAA